MLQKVKDNLDANFPFLKGKKMLLAVSGGIDSVVMLDILYRLGIDIGVAHCNFKLRGIESDEDEVFVKMQCEKKQIPLFVKQFDTEHYSIEHKLSIQLAARKLRYDWFEELLEEQQFDFLLTAHHLDDSLETFLINFTRGTGLQGLTGIPVQNDKIIRPLLCLSRNEIENYAKENTIAWREDSSNESDKYFRNKLRHDVIPILKELNPGLLHSFENTIKNLQNSQALVEDAASIAFKKVVIKGEDKLIISIPKLLEYSNFRAYLYQWLNSYGFTAWEDIYNLVNAQSGKQIFSGTHFLLKNREELILSKTLNYNNEEVFYIEKSQEKVNIPLNITFLHTDKISDISRNTIFVDEKKIRFPLTIRRKREGDVIYPHGMKGSKKLSKFFKDEKLSLIDKSNVWLLCSDNHIVWVIGKRQDSRFAIDNSTTKILQINYYE